MADRFRESFGYLLEVPIGEREWDRIEDFEEYVRGRQGELQALKRELKTILGRYVQEIKVEGKIY